MDHEKGDVIMKRMKHHVKIVRPERLSSPRCDNFDRSEFYYNVSAKDQLQDIFNELQSSFKKLTTQ